MNTKSRACRTPRASVTPITSCGEMTAFRWRWWKRRRPPSIRRRVDSRSKLYADCLETMHGQRPIIFYTNGYETYLWDDRFYAPRRRRRLPQEGRAGVTAPSPSSPRAAGRGAGEERHRRAVLPEAGHREHRRAVLTGAAQGAAGDGDRQRQDPGGCRAGRFAAAGGLGEAGCCFWPTGCRW